MHPTLSWPRLLSQTGHWKRLTTLVSFACITLISNHCVICVLDPHTLEGPSNPHAFKRIAWQVVSQTGQEVWQITRDTVPGTWLPDPLTPDLCDLTMGLESWDIPYGKAGLLPMQVGEILKEM